MASPVDDTYAIAAGVRNVIVGRQLPAGTLDATPLGQLANSMSSGEFRLLKLDETSSVPPNGWQSWTGKCAYNPFNKTMSLIAAAVSGVPHYIWKYDIMDDSFSFEEIGWVTNGHGFDANAVDPNTGRLFFNQFSFGQRYLDFGDPVAEANWANISDTATGANKLPFPSASTNTMQWVPFLNSNTGGCITMGANGKLAWWNNPTDGWNEITTGVADWGFHRDFHSIYQPTLEKAFVGRGTNIWTFGSDLTLTQIAPPETAAGTFVPAYTTGIYFADPSSGKVICVNYATSPYEMASYDEPTDIWSPMPAPSGDVAHLTNSGLQHTTAIIEELGVVVFMTNVNTGTSPRLSLYKPAP